MVVAMAGTYEITVPGWRPSPLNQLLGHWAKAARLKKLDRDHVVLFAGMAHVPKATGRRRVSLRITLPKGQRRWDGDALWKSLLDASVHAGLLIDDNPKWCELGSVEYIRGESLSTTIVIEEVEQE